MRIVEEPFPARITEGSVVTIGKFDGVHVGHRVLLDQVVARARELGAPAVLVTFHRNPRDVMVPGSAPRLIPDRDRRFALFAESGIDVTVVITFDEARAEQTAAEFAEDMLVDRLDAREVIVGEDFRFGRRGQADIGELTALGRAHGFAVTAIPLVGVGAGPKVSSTRIRELIHAGEVAAAGVLLGTPPAVAGRVVHGEARGRELGFPTANLEQEDIGIVPADGVYAGWAVLDGVRHPAAISVSDNPTFDDALGRRVEAHLLDTTLDLYGRYLVVEFVERLRGIERFKTVEELVATMHEDVAGTRAALGLPAAG